MKRSFLLIVMLVAVYCSSGQNYQCLQYGVKHYFTNGNGYLRGIRIDSVKTFPDSTIYYPFHTPRGRYGYFNSTTLDSNGASWLGKNVVQENDGTFLFNNFLGDTITIKTQANIGDTWIFCRDTTNLYYQAAIIDMDTMTILGVLDSVKRILITAHDNTGIIASDPVGSFQIILSKNNGFAQVFDLFTFPYHVPDSSYETGLDYYLDQVVFSNPQPYTLLPVVSPSGLNYSNSLFKIIQFIDPTMQELYNWNIGDVYEYSFCNTIPQLQTPLCNPVTYYYLDTITNKTIGANNTVYNYNGISYFTYNSSFSEDTGTNVYDNSYLVDTSLMPEEYKAKYAYYYFPDDSSFCLRSPLYAFGGIQITGNTYNQPFEGPYTTSYSKIGIGLLEGYSVGEDAGFLVYDKKLLYCVRGGDPCGSYLPLDIPALSSKTNPIEIYPNPATTNITITAVDKITNINITNVLGQTVYRNKYDTERVQLDVSALPNGVYFIKINGTVIKKFVKE